MAEREFALVNEQPVDLKRFLQALRRRRALVAFMVVVGVCAGVGYVSLRPVLPRAAALVILSPSEAGSGSSLDMTTQVIIADSAPVLSAAGASMSPPISGSTLTHRVVATGLSEDIMQIEASGQTPAQARAIANAVASQYIRYVTSDAVGTAKVTLSALQNQAKKLTTAIQQLQDQINAASARLVKEGAASADGQRDTALLTSLRTSQQELSVQLDNITNQIVSTQFSGSLAAGASAVLQNATVVPTSAIRIPEYGAIGALLGFTLASVLAIVRYRRDGRLRTRDEMSLTIGVPVLASISAPRCKSTKDWANLLVRYQPSPVEAWSVRRVLYHLGVGDAGAHPQLSVLVLPDDLAAMAAGVELAKSAALLGHPVALVPGAQRGLVPLRAACAVQRQRAGDSGDRFVFSADTSPGPDSWSASGTTPYTVSLLVMESPMPEIPVGGAHVLALSAGFSNAEMLARVALAASDSGQAIDGILIVNPDPADASTGAVPQELEPPRSMHRPPTPRAGTQAAGRSR